MVGTGTSWLELFKTVRQILNEVLPVVILRVSRLVRMTSNTYENCNLSDNLSFRILLRCIYIIWAGGSPAHTHHPCTDGRLH